MRHQAWSAADTLELAAGQGHLLVTPLQMARAYGAIATGALATPYLIEHGPPAAPAPPNRLALTPATLAALRAALAAPAVERGPPVAGRAATAITAAGVAQAWFAGYAPAEAPALALAVLAERGGEAAAVAVARALVEAGPLPQW
jgi:cell division protein FtsI/penicillin-binding protein 2